MDGPCSIAARIDGRIDGARATIVSVFLQFHECRDPASAGAADPAVQGQWWVPGPSWAWTTYSVEFTPEPGATVTLSGLTERDVQPD